MIFQQKKKVLQVIGNLTGGGVSAELNYLWSVLQHTEKYVFDFCVFDKIGYFGDQMISRGANVFSLNAKYKYDPFIILHLRNAIQKGSYEIVHAHLFPELYFVSIATMGMHEVKLVYSEHSAVNRRRSYYFPFNLLDRFFYQKYSRIIAVSSSTRSNLLHWQPSLMNKIDVIPNTIQVKLLPGSHQLKREKLLQELGLCVSEETKLLLFAGRLIYEKGVDVLIQALASMSNQNCICFIVGDGPNRELLQKETQKLCLQRQILFLGRRFDIIRLMQAVDIFILPSRWEGLPMVILEAMSAGCPIVATEVEGIRDILCDGVSALLVPPDQPYPLFQAINRLLKDSLLAKALSDKALEDVKNYSIDRGAELFMKLYDNVLSENDS